MGSLVKTKEMKDSFGRPISYLRLAVTDRCNLRCFYCMPPEGIQYANKNELLSFEEMERLVRILTGLGITKVRITGGEPFARKNMTGFLEKLSSLSGIKKLTITTNGILTRQHIPVLLALGIRDVNLSLDSMDPEKYRLITRRDEFFTVKKTFDSLLENDFNVKVNAVVMEGLNEDDIIPLAKLTWNLPVSVRFIEEMPFNGSGKNAGYLKWNYIKILSELQQYFPDLESLPQELHGTAMNYKIPGARGTIGIIAAYSRIFCGGCNRIRVTPTGKMKTCLYSKNKLDVRELLRSERNDELIAQKIAEAISTKEKDGFEAEKLRTHSPNTDSMASIGG